MKKHVCKVHGDLNEINAYVCKDDACKGGIRLRCKACCHLNRIARYYLNREENIKKSVEWKKENRDHVNAWEKQNRLNNPEWYEKDTINRICRRRGINLDHYHNLVAEQNSLCAICNKPESRLSKNGKGERKITSLCVDHCHTTNKVRGLLCHACNTAIGKFKDDINIIKSAINYLKKHS